VKNQLTELIKNSGEFSISNLSFIFENNEEASFLLGSSEESSGLARTDPVKRVCQSNKKLEKDIEETLGKAEILLNEIEKIRGLFPNLAKTQ